MMFPYYGIKTLADGHCLFHALSFYFFGDQYHHLALRLVCVNVFIEHFNYFK